MPLADVTVHQATPVSTTQGGNWVEGEPDEVRSTGAAFDCFYMHGRGASTERTPVGGRKVEGPTIIYETERDDGSSVELRDEDEVIIDPLEDEDLWRVLGGEGQTVEVNGAQISGVLFQVEGDPEPFQPPGYVIGFQASLKRVVD